MKYKKPRYTPNKRGTTLFARFRYQEEVRIEVDSKENIQARLDTLNNNKLNFYLILAEGLELTSPRFANRDYDKLGRSLSFLTLNKRKLTLTVKVKSEQQVSREEMLNLDALDTFIAEGKYPENKGNSSQ